MELDFLNLEWRCVEQLPTAQPGVGAPVTCADKSASLREPCSWMGLTTRTPPDEIPIHNYWQYLSLPSADHADRPLPTPRNVHYPAILIQLDMETLIALDAMQGQVVVPAARSQVCQLFRTLRRAQPPP